MKHIVRVCHRLCGLVRCCFAQIDAASHLRLPLLVASDRPPELPTATISRARPSWSGLTDVPSAQNRSLLGIRALSVHTPSSPRRGYRAPAQVFTKDSSGESTTLWPACTIQLTCMWSRHVHDCEGPLHQFSVPHLNIWETGSTRQQLMSTDRFVRRLEIPCSPHRDHGICFTISAESALTVATLSTMNSS